MQAAPHRLVLTSDRLAKVLVSGIGILFLLHGLVMIVAHGLGYPIARGLVPLFHVDFEENVPTFMAFLLLVSCALAAAGLSALETRRARHRRAWGLIAFLLLLVAADEVFGIHEQVGEFLIDSLHISGLPLFAWVVPYSVAVILLAAFFMAWFLELDSKLRLSLFCAGLLFLSGAVGLELVASSHYEGLPPNRDVYRTLTGDLLATLEEALEFSGAAVFLHAMVRNLGGISFRALDPVGLPAQHTAT